MKQVVVDAPAKVNLGLEVIGRRADGFHDIRTVMAMVELCDRLIVFEDETESDDEIDGVSGRDNLIRKALGRFREIVPSSPALGWRIDKRIPAAAGLGGASSNAAAALIAANALADKALTTEELHTIAAELGSDVPFFLGTPAAMASGRGTDLEPLPTISGELILIVPPVTLEAKTQSMYGALKPDDFRDGSAAQEIARALASRQLPAEHLLFNSFSRAARERVAVLSTLWEQLATANVGPFALTGAGPATFLLINRERAGMEVGEVLRPLIGAGFRLIETTFRGEPVTAHLQSTT